jgi:hypothetical protein
VVLCCVLGPRQRDAGAVAADSAAGPHRIHPDLDGDIDLGQPELLPLVELLGAGQSEQSHQGRLGPDAAELAPTEAGD